MYSFLTVLGLCCTGFSLAGASKGYSLVAVRGLLIVLASLVAQPPHRLSGEGLSRCGPPGSRTQAQ